MAKRYSLGFTLFLIFSDAGLVIFSLLLATFLRIVLPYGRPGGYVAFVLPWPLYVVTPLIWIVIFILLNVYDPRHSALLTSEVQSIIRATAVAWPIFAGVLYFTFRDVSRLQTIYYGAIVLVLILLHRMLLRAFFHVTGGRSSDARRVLIIGTGDVARDISSMVNTYRWAGLSLTGFLTENGVNFQRLPAPVLGPIDQARTIIEEHGIHEVVIALASDTDLDIRKLVYDLQWLPLNIRIVPDYFDLAFLLVQVEDFGGMPLLSLKEPTLTPFQRLTKRAFDLILTGVSMIVTLPLMGLIAVAIKLDSAGPVFFNQQRIGEGGTIFTMHKFRTMVPNAEQLAEQVLTYDDEGNIIHKREDDPRITRVGRFLRRTSLDELPQLFNILKGEMSIVGPRPEMPWLVAEYDPWQRKRFEVPQGLTGWWQISGRADKPLHLNTEEDLFYIRNYSLWLDIQIIWKTIGVVLARRGAY